MYVAKLDRPYLEMITQVQRIKSYIFGTHIITRLTTPTIKDDPILSTAQNQHKIVARWTKNVDVFVKDFIFIPVHDIDHWYLVIICFPKMIRPHITSSEAEDDRRKL